MGHQGDIYDDSGYIHMDILANFIVFQPKKGQKLLVSIEKLQLLIDLFNSHSFYKNFFFFLYVAFCFCFLTFIGVLRFGITKCIRFHPFSKKI